MLSKQRTIFVSIWCEEKQKEDFFPFIRHTSTGDNLKHPWWVMLYKTREWFTKVLQLCNQLCNCCWNVWSWRETIQKKMTRTLARGGQLHKLLRKSHFLQEEILRETMLFSWPLLLPEHIHFWNFSSRPQEARGKTGTHPFLPGWKCLKDTLRENQR